MGVGDEQGPIADRYLLLDRLGSGGMGTVWRATDRLLHRTVAVKEVHLLARGEELGRWRRQAHREARAIARISHPNVVDIYDLVDHENRLWLVMELVNGPSLADVAGPMPPARVAEIGRQLLSALDAVHSSGALHRDVKPSNILLRADGQVVLCDFGIVALADTESLTQPGAVVGSLEYIAPERLGDQPVGPASDLFSLGATLYALLTGRSPFARAEAVAVLHAVLQEHPVVPRDVGPLGPLLEALLRKDPADRPSVAEATRMLGPVTAATTIPEYPRGSPTAARPSRRQLLRWGGLAVLVPGAVAVGLVKCVPRDDTQPPADADDTTAPVSPPTDLTSIDAVMPMPGERNRFWAFSGGQYCRIEASAGSYPVREQHTSLAPLENWQSLGSLMDFRDGIDAVLPVHGQRNEYWVFAGNQYLRIEVADGTRDYADSPLTEPASLDDWASTFGALPGFRDGIDAVMPVPGDPAQFWVFSGAEYVRIELAGDEPGEYHRLFGPSPMSFWRDTFRRLSGFRDRIDAVLPVPDQANQFWVFSGGQYIRIEVADEKLDDRLIQDPRPLSG